MIDHKTLRFITQNGMQAFASGRILDGIAALRSILPYCATETIIHADVESIEENYQHMLSFLRKGGDDQKRSEVQAKIMRQGVALMEQANRAIRIKLGTDHYSKALKRIEGIPLLDKWSSLLTPEEVPEVQDDLFDMLWTSPLWTVQDTAHWYDFLLGQRDMVQQHFMGAIFLSAWEHYDSEKIQILNLLADSECHRTHITAITYLLLLRLRYKELTVLMPPLPDSLISRKGRKFIAQVQYEILLMILSEKDMEQEIKEEEALSQNLFTGIKSLNIDNLKTIVELKGRYLRNRLKRGLDPNLSKAPILHSCEYMHRVAHWFLPFDKTHPLFQSVMIDDKGNEKQKFSTLVDLILDCDVDKMTTLYLVSNDKDFSKAIQQVEKQELPDFENVVIPEYTFRFIIQDLYRFFVHSPLSSQLINPFRDEQTLMDFPDIFSLFSADETLACCSLLFELGRNKQALQLLDNLIMSEGASAPALLLKGQALMQMQRYTEATACLRSAEVLQPDNTDILRLLAECYAAQHRFEEELEYLQRLAEIFPDDKTYRHLVPATMAKVGRFEDALQLLFKLDYETAEDDEVIIALIAATAFTLNKLDIAERYTEKELERSDGKKWEAQLRMGHIKLLQGNWKSSLDCYEQSINTYCEGADKDAKVALSQFDADQEVLISKGINKEDILLIHDILQAAALKIS